LPSIEYRNQNDRFTIDANYNRIILTLDIDLHMTFLQLQSLASELSSGVQKVKVGWLKSYSENDTTDRSTFSANAVSK